MEFSTPPGAAALAEEVRQFVAEHLTDEMRERMHRTGTVHDEAFHRAMAGRGWFSAAVPGSSGERDPFELAALFRELELADAPYHGTSTTMMVAGVLEQCASDVLKDRVMPAILGGDAIVSLGYSEPDSGSDVAAARTRAVPTGDGQWRINGQKMWTTLAHVADYVLLLTRTNTDVPKHRGLTMFLVPLDSPGVSVQAVHTMSSERTNVTFYDDVVVGDDWRVGEVDGGWQVMGVALALERGVTGGTAPGERLWNTARAWADESGRLDEPAVRDVLLEGRIDAEVAWLLTQRAAWVATTGGVPSVEGSVAKLWASEAYQRLAEALQELAGPEGLLAAGSPGAVAGGEFERSVRHAAVTTIQGGTSEIQRNNIAERGLGLPSARRRS